jgi:hypothetical protein
MIVREATLEDKLAWDSFVDSEDGGFFHYFDWKHVYEAGGDQFIPLLIETAPSRLVGILPVVKERKLLYSILESLPEGASGGCLLERGLSDEGRYEATSALLEYLDANYSRGCSTSILHENLTVVGKQSGDPTPALVNRGFRFRFDKSTCLPCTHVLELKQPFEENIWGKWSPNFKRALKKVVKDGVVVVRDPELNYAEVFTDMLIENCRLNRYKIPKRDEVMVRLKVFRDRSRLFVALRDGKPIASLLCHYTPSTCYLSKTGSYEKDTDNANRLCYKVAVEDACNTGYRSVEFGVTATSSLAFFKDRFKGTRVPMRVYEKRYSIPRTVMQEAPLLVSNVWRDKSYIWNSRRKFWDMIVHG